MQKYKEDLSSAIEEGEELAQSPFGDNLSRVGVWNSGNGCLMRRALIVIFCRGLQSPFAYSDQ